MFRLHPKRRQVLIPEAIQDLEAVDKVVMEEDTAVRGDMAAVEVCVAVCVEGEEVSNGVPNGH